MNFPIDLMAAQAGRPDQAKSIADIVAALSTIEDLKGLTEEEFTGLATHGTESFGKDGDLVFSQGNSPGTPDVHPARRCSRQAPLIKPSLHPDRPDGADYGKTPFSGSRHGTRTGARPETHGFSSCTTADSQNYSRRYHP